MESALDGLGKRIRQARELAGYSCAQLAETVGVDRTRPYRWQSGSERPALDTLVRVATALRVDLHWLLTGKRWKA